MKRQKAQLRIPAGNLKAVQAAIDHGADAIYIGFQSPSNLRNYPGINFSFEEAKKGVELAHQAGKKFYVVINSYPQAEELASSFKAIDEAWGIDADAVMLSDLAVMDYARNKYPDLNIHLSVQAGATNAQTINFYRDQFGISCAVLPRVLTLAEVREICAATDVEIEVFAMGSLCAGYSGRCSASQYITGEVINTRGVCTSPRYLDFVEDEQGSVSVSLNGVTLNKFSSDEITPSLAPCTGHKGSEVVEMQGLDGWHNSFLVNKRHVCKGRYISEATGKKGSILHSTIILNTLPILPQLIEAGVGALKVEGRQRPSLYSAATARILREAIDLYYANPEAYQVRQNWLDEVSRLFEEMTSSEGAYVGR